MSPLFDGEPVYVRAPEAQIKYFFCAPVKSDESLTLYNACDLQDDEYLDGFEIVPVLPNDARAGEGSVVEVYKDESIIPSMTVVHKTNMSGIYARISYDTSFHATDPLAFSRATMDKLGASKNDKYLASIQK